MKGDFSRLTFKKVKHFAAVLSQQGRVLLDSEKNEDESIETYLRETSLTDVIGQSGVPLDDSNAFAIDYTSSKLTIKPGHMYVDGILVENDTQTDFTTQPYKSAAGEAINPPAGTRTDLVYLEVWKQHVTALEDPDIREKALNIPDTTTRLRTLWRVHVLQNVGNNVDCGDPIANFPPQATTTRLTNSVSLAALPDDPCVIAPDGGFRLLENRLMRVEVHKGSDAAGGPTAKWSAENAAVVYGITAVNPITIVVGGSPKPGLQLTLKQQARDQFLSFGIGDTVEIVSGEDEIRGNPGVLGTIHERISDTVYDVLLNAGEVVPAAYTASLLPQSLYTPGLVDFKVRRWDGILGKITGAGGALGNTGVSVSFPTVGFARSGDYWVFAGRTANVASADESIEKLTNAPAQGVERHYTRLALIQWSGGTPTIVDCRNKFPPLTGMVELHYVSGDGQEAKPGETIKPLIVRVSNGGIPLENVEVSFAPVGGSAVSGSVSPASPVKTDIHGLATVDWALNSATYRQQVLATLVANPDLQVIFNANLSVAAEVGYTPKDPSCWSPAVDNVKDALDQLCERKEPEDPGIHIEKIAWAMDGAPADNNSRIPLSRLLNGLVVATDRGIAADSISRATCYMVVEVPMQAADPDSWLFPIVIRADESVNGTEILWKAISFPASMIAALKGLNGKDREQGLLARFTLKGNFIRDKKSKLYLDGEDFGVPDGAASFNLLPLDIGVSGDKRSGGDFYMWFWVVPENVEPDEGRYGYLIRTGGISREIFNNDFDRLINFYADTIDLAIDRPKLTPTNFPDDPTYQPLPLPFDLALANDRWQQTILSEVGALDGGTILVFAPNSLKLLTRVLCGMWGQIQQGPDYKFIFLPDASFESDLLARMQTEEAAGSGRSMIVVNTQTTAQSLSDQFPDEFSMDTFRPI